MADSTPERQDLRERITKALIARIKQSVIIDPVKQPGTVGQPLAATEHDLADAVLAVLVEPPGDLLEQMAAEVRRHHNTRDIRSEDWSVAGDACICGETVTDWAAHLAAAALSVRWEYAARQEAENERLREENAYLHPSLRGAEDRRQMWRERAERAEQELPKAVGMATQHARKAIENGQRADAAEAQVAALQRDLESVTFDLKVARSELGKADQENNAAGKRADRAERELTEALEIYREHRRFHPSPFADCQACRMGVTISRALPSRPDDPEEIRRLAESAEAET